MDNKIDPCDTMRVNLIAAAVGLQQCTKTGACVIPLPGTDRVIAIGAPADVERLLGAHAGVAAQTQGEPVAWLRFWAAQYSTGEGNIGTDEGLEVCAPHEFGMDGLPAFPVYAAPAAQAPVQNAEEVPSQWISVDDRLPKKYCLAAYVNSAGRHRIIRAMHVKQYEIEATGDDCYSEYREEDDTEYIKPGWYECIDNWGEYSRCFVNEGTVTHWMPLPAAPAQQSVQGENGGDSEP